MKHDEFFRKRPVFTSAEFAQHLARRAVSGERAQESILAYHQKAGRILRVKRGLYAVIPPGFDPESFPVDPFLVAAKLAPDAVLSHQTALEFHGRAHSVQERFVYSASNPPRPLTLRSQAFRGVCFPKALVAASKEMFAVSRAERAGLEIWVSNFERTLVDVLDRPGLSGSWEEIWRSLESVEFFDLDTVVEYVRILGNATTAAKVGFFLDQCREALMVDEAHLQALREMRPRHPHYLDRSSRVPGRLASEWNLVVPKELLDRSWGEVL